MDLSFLLEYIDVVPFWDLSLYRLYAERDWSKIS